MKGCDTTFMKKTTELLPVSVVIITLNEERNIERLLKSVSWASEVVVYDSGSTDLTCAVAQKMGAKVYQGDWLGFGPTKQKAVSLATQDWILSLDADEEVPEVLWAELRELWPRLSPQKRYQIPRLSWYLNRWIWHGGWYPDFQIRLFHRQYANWNKAKIHEKVEALTTKEDSAPPAIEKLTSPFYHYVFKNIEHQVQTNNKYSSLQAQQMAQAGRRFSWFHFLTKPLVKFVECYIWKLGFLDGWAGYVIARSAAYSVFLKWAKLKELEQQL